jgi:hypothetical protein
MANTMCEYLRKCGDFNGDFIGILKNKYVCLKNSGKAWGDTYLLSDIGWIVIQPLLYQKYQANNVFVEQ